MSKDRIRSLESAATDHHRQSDELRKRIRELSKTIRCGSYSILVSAASIHIDESFPDLVCCCNTKSAYKDKERSEAQAASVDRQSEARYAVSADHYSRVRASKDMIDVLPILSVWKNCGQESNSKRKTCRERASCKPVGNKHWTRRWAWECLEIRCSPPLFCFMDFNNFSFLLGCRS